MHSDSPPSTFHTHRCEQPPLFSIHMFCKPEEEKNAISQQNKTKQTTLLFLHAQHQTRECSLDSLFAPLLATGCEWADRQNAETSCSPVPASSLKMVEISPHLPNNRTQNPPNSHQVPCSSKWVQLCCCSIGELSRSLH